MKFPTILSIAFLGLMVAASNGLAIETAPISPWEQEMAKLKQGMPADVSRFIDCFDICQHFAGEEPYDEARATEIQEQLKLNSCDTLDTDEQSLRSKYEKDLQILERITKAKNKIVYG